MFAWVILSWIQVTPGHPLARFRVGLDRIILPVIRPIRSVVPPIPDLRSKDNDFSKFRFVRGGVRQPAVREKNRGSEVLIANHPFKSLAIDLGARLGLAAIAGRLSYQISDLSSPRFTGRYRSITAPIFNGRSVCTEAINVVDIEPFLPHNQTSFGSPAPGR